MYQRFSMTNSSCLSGGGELMDIACPIMYSLNRTRRWAASRGIRATSSSTGCISSRPYSGSLGEVRAFNASRSLLSKFMALSPVKEPWNRALARAEAMLVLFLVIVKLPRNEFTIEAQLSVLQYQSWQ